MFYSVHQNIAQSQMLTRQNQSIQTYNILTKTSCHKLNVQKARQKN